MGRIKNDNLYIFDSPASKFDKVIGSDAENAGRTKNYLLGGLFALFNTLGGGGVFSYTYTSDLADLDILEGLVATNDSETDPDGVNLLRFSRTDLFGNDLRTLVENYNNNSDGVVLKITSEADPNLICAYTITGINVDTNWVEISVLKHKNLSTLTFEVAKNFTLTFDLVNLDGFGGGGGATNTSQLVNDGEDGINPFISLQDLITDHTALSNIGLNTHVQIDSHIADSTIHFTQASISITEAQISDLQPYLLAETDPVFSAWLATPPNVSIFTNDAGYLTSFTETDPIFLASPAGGITNIDIDNWNTTFGWGNHALAGYLYITDIDTFAELDGLVVDANLVKEGDNVSVFVNDGVYMTEAVYDPAGIAEQLVGLTAPQTVLNKNLSNTGYINFDITYVPTGLETTGTLYWNETDETIDLVRNGTVLQLGQELYTRTRNVTGVLIPNGSVVYSSGHTGIFPDISLAQGNSEATGDTIGITTEDIANNAFGAVTTFGYVRGLKTDYVGAGVWGTTWVENDRLWLSKDVPGGLTNVEPSAPNHSDEVAVVGVVHPTQGTILVGINRHKRLDQLSDVNGTATDTNGQILVWDNDNQYFDFTHNINDYATTTLVGSAEEEEINFVGGETNWVLSQSPSTLFPHRLYAGTTAGGGLILLDEGVDYTISGNTITYLSPVLPIDSDEKHIIHYNLPSAPSGYSDPNSDVKIRNADMYDVINTNAYYKNGTVWDSRNLQLMVVTDLHGDTVAVQNAVTMMNEFGTIDGGLNMGDTCINTWLDDFTFAEPLHSIGKPFLIAIGNHDVGLNYTIANTGSTTQAYNRFIQPNETQIAGTHAGKNYYYKDWATYNIRTIVLFEYDNDDVDPGDPLLYRIRKTTRVWSQAQIDWLVATLNSTPAGYSVVITMHQIVQDQITWTNSIFTDINHIAPGDSSTVSDEAIIPEIVNAWINGTTLVGSYPFIGEGAYLPNITVNADFTSRGAGDFICYMAGHAHVDVVGTVPAFPDQTQIVLTCTTSDASRNRYGDLQRQVGKRSEDCINVVSFDTSNRQIKIARIGAQITFDMRKRDFIAIDY